MKLNKITSALVVAGLALSSSVVWSAAPDPLTLPLIDPSLGSGTLTNPAAVNVNATRVDVKSATNGSQATNVLTTPTVNLGAQTGTGANAPVQGTLGGPGGVSGLVTTVAKSTTGYNVGTVIKAGTAYEAGSILGGTTYATAGVLGAAVTTVAGDVLNSVSTYGTGIKGTDHDFIGHLSGNAGSIGLCTYCHTPHKGSSTLLLWNHTLSSNTFAWDVAATTAGTALPAFSGTTYKGPSAKCLACHDGTIAIGDIGWFNQSARQGTAAMNTNKLTNTAKLMGNNNGDLTGTHPVAIPYPLSGAPNVYNTSTTGARLATNDFVADPTANNIRLYSDLGGGQIVGKVTPGKTGIECSSCHDPHNKAATDRFFLRGKLVGSTQADGYICAQCHSK